ncbi:glycosyltransferase family 2 protein [Thioalkalivibrio thiocyanodenitrificans]|uniref:glycosyltransferase family 2 protein n=1 Tax=Thioalkalivibrio thiocyanodenitrificans TaxID=243063 RepID=UPI0018DDCF90|nr:glycosyltransferase [Thioalkalivibrio thiocyanodenitrificans]
MKESRSRVLDTRIGCEVEKDPHVSVVVISVDSQPCIVSAVESILKQGGHAEVIVVNTGAGSVGPLLRGCLDRIILVESPGRCLPGGARNIGILHATGPVIAFLAADCMATPDWLRHRLNLHHRGHCMVASSLRPAADESGRISLVSWAAYCLIHARRMPEIPEDGASRHGVSYCRTAFERHGLFREDLRVAEDSLFNRRAAATCGRPVWAPQIMSLHRYPGRMLPALADQFRRARRDAWRVRVDVRRSPLRLLRVYLSSAFRASTNIVKFASGEERVAMRKALLLMPFLLLSAYIGCLSIYVSGRGGQGPS